MRNTTTDRELRGRAAAVVPGGMYGHLRADELGPGFPQFFSRGAGARVWDVDGNELVDLMCSWGPMVLGHRHPAVEAAVRRQLDDGECLDGPTPAMVELAELLVDTVAHADWAMFCKNGTDATTMAITIARAATGRSKILVAKGAYHGSAPWCTPVPAGVTEQDRMNIVRYEYNDLASVRAAVDAAGGDVAAVLACPIRHDTYRDEELADPVFATGLRALCDELGAALILDEVRTGLRLDLAGSWEPLGVRPDLSAWSKALGNGHAIAAVLGADPLRDAARSLYATGSFWMAASPMVAALTTIRTLRDGGGIAAMERAGTRLRDGLAAQAAAHGVGIVQTGPVQLPFLRFEGDPDWSVARRWASAAVAAGAYVHPFHNWFLGAAHTDADIDRALDATDAAFAAVAAAALSPA